jgi:uncharacterized protein (TIGR00369 family)
MSANLQIPISPSAHHLGWKLLEYDAAMGHVRIGFQPRAEFLNPAGCIQGGFIAAMLDDCMGPAIWIHSSGQSYSATIGMQVNFLRTARLGPLVGEGKVLQLGKTIGFVESRLLDAEHQLLAQATASVRLLPAPQIVR